jgi:hypothetical protein
MDTFYDYKLRRTVLYRKNFIFSRDGQACKWDRIGMHMPTPPLSSQYDEIRKKFSNELQERGAKFYQTGIYGKEGELAPSKKANKSYTLIMEQAAIVKDNRDEYKDKKGKYNTVKIMDKFQCSHQRACLIAKAAKQNF